MTHGGRLWVARSILITVATLSFISCRNSVDERPETPPVAEQFTVAVIDDQAVGNATYMSQFTESGFVELENGEFSDLAQRVHAALDPHRAFGDLDGDSTIESAVIVSTNTGGSGGFVDLAILDLRNGQIVNVATRFLGDRLRIHSLDIRDHEVVLDATMHTPDDPMCCPSLRAVRRFRLKRGSLIENGRPEGAMDHGSPTGDLIE